MQRNRKRETKNGDRKRNMNRMIRRYGEMNRVRQKNRILPRNLKEDKNPTTSKINLKKI
jgi:hypothetical protein